MNEGERVKERERERDTHLPHASNMHIGTPGSPTQDSSLPAYLHLHPAETENMMAKVRQALSGIIGYNQ